MWQRKVPAQGTKRPRTECWFTHMFTHTHRLSGRGGKEETLDDLDSMLEMDSPLAKENLTLKKQMEQVGLQQQAQLYTMQTQMEEFMRSVMDQRRNPDAPIVPPGPAAANIIYIYILYIVHMLFCFSNIFFPYES